MKINDTSRVGRMNPYQNKAASLPAAEAKKKRQDEVQISTEAKEMLSSMANSQKLDELKMAVSAGTYQVDARKLADKLWPFVK